MIALYWKRRNDLEHLHQTTQAHEQGGFTMKALLDELGNLSATYGRTELEKACKTFFSRGHGAVRQKRKRIPRAWVLEALDRQGGRCAIGGEPLHVSDAVGDHKIPINPR